MQFSTPSSQIISYDFSILTRTSKSKCIAICPLRESSSIWITGIWLHWRAINLIRFKREHLPRLLCSIFIISGYCWSHSFDLTLLFIQFLTFFQLLTLLLSHLAIWLRIMIIILIIIIFILIFLFILLSIVFQLLLKRFIYFFFIHFLSIIYIIFFF